MPYGALSSHIRSEGYAAPTYMQVQNYTIYSAPTSIQLKKCV